MSRGHRLRHAVSALTMALAGLCDLPATGVAAELPGAVADRAQDLVSLRAGFTGPPREAAPWVYWFWWNSVVSREEIGRELEELAAAGFGGAELRVVTFHGWGGKPLAGMDAASLERMGHRQLSYLSDEWLDVMEFTCATAERLGLRLTINLGQGWPPGGPWIADEHRTRHLSWKSTEVTGPGTFSPEELPKEGMVFAWKLTETEQAKIIATNSFRDLTGLILPDGSRRTLRWDVPPGRWLIGVFSVTPGGICDKGEGPEVDPASRQAVLFHLTHMFGRLDSKLRRFHGNTLVDVASDSWEYERHRGGGRYWSPAILDAFPQLAGYDLREKMHALLGYGPEHERVLHDLEQVERQLVRDSYFKTVADFLHARGLRHRPQIYGRGLARDLLEAYTLADTPEVEQGDYCLPEAAWAARTTGKPIISCEAFTHLHLKMGLVRRPHGEWESNPAALRGAANAILGEGVNRIQMHSFSYSPPGLPLPGWRMYAEIHLNRNVPWWPFMKPLNTWLARQQWLLQAGWPVADTLVYPVMSNPPDGPFRQMDDLQPISAANAVDAANQRTLTLIGTGEMRYDAKHVLLLDELKTVVEAESILAVMDRGARVSCAHSLPEQWPALRSTGAAGLRERFAAAQAEGRVLDRRAEGWKAALADAQSVRWSPATTHLVFQHRRVPGANVYVLFNYGDDFDGEVSFPHAGERVELWDADTGRMAPVARMTDRDDRIYIPLSLGHSESRAFVISPANRPVHVTQAPGGEFYYDDQRKLRGRFEDTGEYPQIRLSDGTGRNLVVAVPAPVVVRGPWQLSVSASQAVSPQPPLTLRLDHLVSWRELPELKHYAGAATYTTTFDLEPELIGDDRGLTLHLGAVFELARVLVNGREAGTAYAPPFRVDVTALVKAARNTLEIEVPNQLKNHLERGANYRRPSGLLGPVLLVPDRRITLADDRKTSPLPAKAPAAGSAGGPQETTHRRLSPPSVSTAEDGMTFNLEKSP